MVLPTSPARQLGPVAGWVSTAGWTAAAARVLGAAWIVTDQGVLTPDEARTKASNPRLGAASASGVRRHVPTLAKTLAKDALEYRRARAFRVAARGPWDGTQVAFVWQRHELFHTAGFALADELAVPSVLFVPAVKVWEARSWGVRRPLFGRWLERAGEAPALRRADVVACGTDLVAEQVLRLGVAPERVLVTPTGVDLDFFSDLPDAEPLRRELGLTGRFVVGWVGSFRRMHSLDRLIDATAGLEGATLLFVGDGPERPHIEQRARERGVHAVFTGTVSHDALPAHLSVFDTAVVVAGTDHEYHYSPLKLAEYLAAGRAVVAPRVSQLTARLRDGEDVLFVEPGDTAALRRALIVLQGDAMRREHLGRNARAAARAGWSWDRQIERIVEFLPARSSRSSADER